MTDSPYVTKAVCNEHGKMLDERFARDKADIGSIENNLRELSNIVTRLATLQENNAAAQAEHEARIRALELQPAGRWNTLITAGISALGGGVAGALLSTIIK